MVEKIKKYIVGIVGNPNSGKTSLFNVLTGGKQKVGNWPGVTVDKISGSYVYDGIGVELIDLPGIYSLTSNSLDEKIARDYILQEKPNLIINIIDASNLERNLYLTMQLLEMRIPMLIVLNMIDIVKRKNLKIKYELFAKILDLPIVTTVASKNEGIDELKQAVNKALLEEHISRVDIYFPADIENLLNNVEKYISEYMPYLEYDKRWYAVKILEEDIVVESNDIYALIQDDKKKVENILGEDVSIIIAESRYGYINTLCRKVLDKSNIIRKNATDLIDRVVLNSFLGVPVFLLIMYAVFWFTVNVGGKFVRLFENISGTIFIDGIRNVLTFLRLPEFFIYLFSEGVGGGIQTVATFIPPVFFIFLALALLEDSGYMSRAAFVMDKFMRTIGLPGKAFVPMMIGFGCNVPAIMATRTLDNEKDRILTILINPLMSCGARMPTYALFAAVFFPNYGGIIIFVIYLIGILIAMATGFVFKRTLFKSEVSSFIMELPPYHIPTLKGVFLHSWERLKSFVFRAGKVLVVVVFFITLLNSFPLDESKEKSNLLAKTASVIMPVFKPMGITEDNWPAVVGLVSGIFAKETVVGTLNTLYVQKVDGDKKEGFSYEVLREKFDGKVGAFAYLLFVLIYMPCLAVATVIYKELSLKWALFSSVYLTVLAWCISVLFYQTLRFSLHPIYSVIWITIVLGIITAFIVFLKKVKI